VTDPARFYSLAPAVPAFSRKNRLNPRLSQNLLTFSGLVRRRGFSGFGKNAPVPWRPEVSGAAGFGLRSDPLLKLVTGSSDEAVLI